MTKTKPDFNLSEHEMWKWDPMTNYLTDLLPDETFGICVKLSGGADSSIIYYRLCKEIAERNLNIPMYVATLDTDIKPWYSHYAKKVIEFTAERTGIRPVEHNITLLSQPWDDAKYTSVQDEVAYKTLHEGKTNVMFGGLTQNPPPEDQAAAAMIVPGIKVIAELDDPESWPTDNPERRFEYPPPTNEYDTVLRLCGKRDIRRDDLSGKVIRGHDMGSADMSFYAIHPFIHRDKKESTAQMYIDNDMVDDLLPLTYSCEMNYDHNRKVNLDTIMRTDLAGGPRYEQEHCGRCWFCLERAYAFGRLV